MRFVFLFILLAGAGLGIGYPWAAANVTGYEIGRYEVFRPDNGFVEVWSEIAPSEAPVTVTVEMNMQGPLPKGAGDILSIVASGGERIVFNRLLDFAGAEQRTINPQTGETLYTMIVDKILVVDENSYHFLVSAEGGGADKINSVDLIINAGAFDLDPRIIPIGYILMAIGLVGFIASFRRRPQNPNSSPPTSRWGRNGKS